MPLSWRQLASLLGPAGSMPPQVAWLANPQVNERRLLLRAHQDFTLLRVDAVLTGGTSPSVSFSLSHGADVSAAGTAVATDPLSVTSTTAGNAITNFAIPDIPAGHWLWLQLTAVSGSPQALTVSIELQ